MTCPWASASSAISSNSRRVRSTLTPPTNAWNWSGRIADHERPGVDARLGALAPPHDRLDARDQLLRVARLRDPVVGAQPQPAHPLRHRRLPGADDHAEPRQPRADLLQVVPPLRTQDRQIDHDGVQPHRDDRVERNRAREHAVLPARALDAIRQHLQEARVRVEHRYADRRLRHLARRIRPRADAMRPDNSLVTSWGEMRR
jgi:hypothetical protein